MKEHFADYTEIYNRIKELAYKLEVIEHNLYGTKAISYGTQIKSTNPRTMVDRICEKDEVEAEIKKLKSEKHILYDKHIREISVVSDDRKRRILRCYYLDKLTVSDISNLLCLTDKRLYQLKKEAEVEFCEKIIQNATN